MMLEGAVGIIQCYVGYIEGALSIWGLLFASSGSSGITQNHPPGVYSTPSHDKFMTIFFSDAALGSLTE